MDLLEELLAERDIRKVLALYAQYADDNKVDDWVDLFAENGAMTAGPKRMEGHEALRAWLVKVQSGPKMRHLMSNATINIDSPTSATVMVDMALLRANGAHWALAASPRYSDKLVRTEKGWKFLERVVDHRAP